MHRHVSQDLAQVCLRRPMGFGEPAACVPPPVGMCTLVGENGHLYHYIPLGTIQSLQPPPRGRGARCILGEA